MIFKKIATIYYLWNKSYFYKRRREIQIFSNNLLILTLKRLDRKNKFANSLDYSLFLVENNV